MSKAEDINTLYRRFGGNASSYQETGASDMAGAAVNRWPILGELRPQSHREAPDARKGGAAVGDRQVRSFLVPPVGAQSASAQESRVVTDPVPVAEPVAVVEPVHQPVSVAHSHAVQPLPDAAMHSAPPESVPELAARPKVKVAVKSPARAVRGGTRESAPVNAEPAWHGKADAVPVQAAAPLPVQVSKRPTPAKAAPKKQVAAKKKMTPIKVENVSPDEGTELQSVFNRLVPRKVEASVSPSAASLKKLVKW